MSICIYFFDAEIQIPETWLQPFSPLFSPPPPDSPRELSAGYKFTIHYEYSNLLSQVKAGFHGVEAFGL